ncbi:MAG: DNA-binding protein [Candidatus Omnitrophica bacterium]|nr:DNA-binding protein [Candidatus Omnitrophota bacterium]
MSKNLKSVLFLVLMAICLAASVCFAQPLTSQELIERAKEYDGKTISYLGEAIGDVMYRGDFAWVNVNDGSNAIGIWVKKDLAEKITLTGSYKFIGDTILVEGRFNRSCLEHGGDLDIHANSLTIIKNGSKVEEKINIYKIIAGLAFMAIVLFLGLLRFLRKAFRKR